MTCEICSPSHDAADPNIPHVIRTCAHCGAEYRFRATGSYGYGIKIEEGDRFVLPADFIKLSANPLKGNGQFTRDGIAWFAELLFVADFSKKASRDSLLNQLESLQLENEKLFVNAAVLSGLELDDPEMELEVFNRLNANPKTIEWWSYMAAGMTNLTAKAVESGDAATAAWAGICAERFRTLAIFRAHFEEPVFMGNSAFRLVQFIEIWRVHRENGSEGFWQETLKQHAYAFDQLFSVPITFIQEAAYVGGMKIDSKDARYVDFMLSGGSSDDAILIEIKTPTTSLLRGMYRKNAYAPSKDLTGSVIQISDYCWNLRKEITKNATGKAINAFKPKMLIIIGNYENELDNDKKRNSFEMFRTSLRDIEIITFDELFKKAENLAKLFNIVRGNSVSVNDETPA